jgi:hypothetical protein
MLQVYFRMQPKPFILMSVGLGWVYSPRRRWRSSLLKLLPLALYVRLSRADTRKCLSGIDLIVARMQRSFHAGQVCYELGSRE